MEIELQEQLKKVLSDNVGNFWAGTDNIISFIDQNFIGKEELREKVDKLKDGNHPLGYFWAMEKVLKLLK